MEEREVYESPTIEVIEFELSESIAASTNNGVGTFEWDID